MPALRSPVSSSIFISSDEIDMKVNIYFGGREKDQDSNCFSLVGKARCEIDVYLEHNKGYDGGEDETDGRENHSDDGYEPEREDDSDDDAVNRPREDEEGEKSEDEAPVEKEIE
ncbi:unnamed protein product [Thlaspi arvense]|uniref:Uncharacterized protein n=1 Tax=Thlaspi arvense TaxID=13288 RepID=A0AAU9SR37_THLAR|nr:unnamed protein product [Thlaspi arvense]